MVERDIVDTAFRTLFSTMLPALCYDIIRSTELEVYWLEAVCDNSLHDGVWLRHDRSLLLLLLLLLLLIWSWCRAMAMHWLTWSMRVHLRHGGKNVEDVVNNGEQDSNSRPICQQSASIPATWCT